MGQEPSWSLAEFLRNSAAYEIWAELKQDLTLSTITSTAHAHEPEMEANIHYTETRNMHFRGRCRSGATFAAIFSHALAPVVLGPRWIGELTLLQ